jgi:hypothetical protein
MQVMLSAVYDLQQVATILCSVCSVDAMAVKKLLFVEIPELSSFYETRSFLGFDGRSCQASKPPCSTMTRTTTNSALAERADRFSVAEVAAHRTNFPLWLHAPAEATRGVVTCGNMGS